MLKRLFFVALLLCASVAQAAVYSLPWGPKPQWVDANGVPMNQGTLTFYAAGTTTLQNTYTTQTGSVANANPLTLNSRGESQNEVWLTGGQSYKLVLKDSAGATVWTVDSISGVNDPAATVSEWITAATPTYVSANSFTLANDQTTTFTPGRRAKFTVTAGTVYGTIYTSSYVNPITTVTMVMDSVTGNLDSGLSNVSYGLLSTVSPSLPFTPQETLASATTTTLASARGPSLHVSGVTTITGFGNAPSGLQRAVIFDGVLTLTHNGTSLILPGAVNITTAAGDVGVFVSEGSGNWRCISYVGKNGSFNNANVAGVLSVADGSAATPGMTFTADPDTGIFRATANAVSIAGQGAEQVRITGTASATRYLTLAGSNGSNPTIDVSAGSIQLSTGGPTVYIGTTGGGNLQLGNGPNANGASSVRLVGSNTASNWALFNNQTIAGALEFIPSTAGGGSTFTTNVGMFTTGGYFKASNTGSYDSSTAAYHELVTNQASTQIATLFNSHASAPLGIQIKFTADPNGTGNYAWYFDANGVRRAEMRSNGGLANFSANNVNLSDATVKTALRPASSYWNFLKSLQVVDGYYSDELQTHGAAARRHTMLTAQNVQMVEAKLNIGARDSVVTMFDQEHLGLQEHAIEMRHIRVTQELQARVESLEKKLAALEARIAANDSTYRVAAGR